MSKLIGGTFTVKKYQPNSSECRAEPATIAVYVSEGGVELSVDGAMFVMHPGFAAALASLLISAAAEREQMKIEEGKSEMSNDVQCDTYGVTHPHACHPNRMDQPS